jgi:hypothetical protein
MKASSFFWLARHLLLKVLWLTKDRHHEVHCHPHMEICLKHLNLCDLGQSTPE